MSQIKIIQTEDSYECDDCGWSHAEGGRVYIDDVLIFEFQPSAYCYDSDEISVEELLYQACQHFGNYPLGSTERELIKLLENLGHTVTIERE